MSEDKGIFTGLRERIAAMPVIDSHEHIRSESLRRLSPMGLTQIGYVGCDLCGAGVSWDDAEAVENADSNPEQAKRAFLEHWPHTRTTGYGRFIQRTLEGVFGVDELDSETYEMVDRRLRQGPGESYDKWFRERYNIRAVILDTDTWEDYPDFFYRSLWHVKHFALCDSRPALDELERRTGCSIHSAAQMRDAMWTYLEKLMEERPEVVALKNSLAYNRSILFERRTLAEADRAFNRLFADKRPSHAESWIERRHRSYGELAPLQDFLVHESVRFAEEHGLVYQVHTGLQSGYTNEITDSRAVLLTNLVSEYRDVRFALFHGGFPYCREWGVMGKNFPNVYLDFCWMHIISPATAVQMLDEWLDYVPHNKFFGFGGDVKLVESVFGHLEMARDNIARALGRKVARGDFSMDLALEVARRMLFDNPNEVFGLGLEA